MDTTGNERPNTRPDDAAQVARRLEEVSARVKLELARDGFGPDARGRGFDPYDGRLGRTTRDIWGTRRRA